MSADPEPDDARPDDGRERRGTEPRDAPDTRDELLERAAAYARTVDLDVDLAAVDWEISDRAKRRAGACVYDPDTGRVTIRLTWDAYRAFGWAEFAGTVRHELVHAWEFQRFGDSGHGDRFRRKAAAVDAPRHCRTFAEPRLRLDCTDCAWTADRHRASKAVSRPSERRCGACGSRYRVEHVATGRTWRTRAGYLVARRRLGDEW
ncbi:sprT domain-containing protein [halophilic archaeon]|nr:sprT domain-containing protein [halophilic archaeon]